MRKVCVVVLCVGIGVLSGCKQHDVVAEVTAREQQVNQAFNSGNVALERDLIADDFVAVTMDGSRYDKAKALDWVAESKQSGSSFTTDGITVKAFGDVAVAQGFDHYRNADGTRRKSAAWTDIWARRDGTWRMVAAQDTWITP